MGDSQAKETEGPERNLQKDLYGGLDAAVLLVLTRSHDGGQGSRSHDGGQGSRSHDGGQGSRSHDGGQGSWFVRLRAKLPLFCKVRVRRHSPGSGHLPMFSRRWIQTFLQDSFLDTLKMSILMPPTLLKLAAKRLLRDQASAIAALEYLPTELFPYLFEMVYRGGRHPQLLKALAQAWPFTVLPLRVLMQHPPDHAPTRAVGLKAVFDAIDVVLAQEVRPRRCKLRVLDLRNTGANFWDMWLRVSTENCSLRELLTMHSSGPGMEHPLAPLEVFLDLTFDERDQDKFFMHIIQWAQQREGSLHLCCKTLRTFGVPFQRVRRVLNGVRLGCIQEVEVNCTWDLSTLGAFALYLGSMSNLQEIFLMGKEVQEGERQEQEEQQSFSEFLSQMLRLRHLRDLELCSLSFLPGRLDQVLRCLQIPLYKFCVMCCPRLTHSDLTHLFQCPNLRQLRVLHLFGVDLADFSEPLRALLEAVAPTLQFLGLDKCGMADSQVEAILPVLSHCHQLRHFTICMNNFPGATVEKLLRHTAGLRSLQREVYPVPLEGYRTQGTVNKERLALIKAELVRVLRELGQPRTIQLATKHFRHRKVYEVAFS
ncbi:PRAME family member 8-like [Myotis myotis]|uniref:PRAME family member 8-like n=1 Tax=Myotis myotis TaxID=51298 RepID=UPI00174C7DED|nr:PRAME family member 8-like [Myotis myotis]